MKNKIPRFSFVLEVKMNTQMVNIIDNWRTNYGYQIKFSRLSLGFGSQMNNWPEK